MNDQEVYTMFSKAGFTAAEIARLQQLQRDYAQKKSSQESDFKTVSLEDAMDEADNAMKDKEASDILFNDGFSASEIARLQQLRLGYLEDMSGAHRQHEFIRWLGTASHKIFGETYPEWTRYQ